MYFPEKVFGTIGVPLLFSGSYGLTNNLSFDFGAGFLVLAYNTVNEDEPPGSPDYVARDAEIELTGSTGIRFITNKGFMIRINYTPILMTYHNDYVSWGGSSFGYCFE